MRTHWLNVAVGRIHPEEYALAFIDPTGPAYWAIVAPDEWLVWRRPHAPLTSPSGQAPDVTADGWPKIIAEGQVQDVALPHLGTTWPPQLASLLQRSQIASNDLRVIQRALQETLLPTVQQDRPGATSLLLVETPRIQLGVRETALPRRRKPMDTGQPDPASTWIACPGSA